MGGHVLLKNLFHWRTFIFGEYVLWDDISDCRICQKGRHILRGMEGGDMSYSRMKSCLTGGMFQGKNILQVDVVLDDIDVTGSIDITA